MFHRTYRPFYQVASVISYFKLYAGRQAALHGGHFVFHRMDHHIGIFAITHYDDTADSFPFAILIKNTQPQVAAHLHGGNILYPYRHGVNSGNGDIFDILYALDITQPAHNIACAVHFKLAPAYIVIIAFNRF
ncbi:hypothetical protein GALL_484630 [mine drainage metagenome]|uniref:Uncharacterized protein n=1 Tax=mine drainage metagenome TaxID=410659 RepID=A0A1J5PQT4_9ZZZZ